MQNQTTWTLEEHTEAKHLLLRAFIDAWLPIIGNQEIRVNSQNPVVQVPRLRLYLGLTSGVTGST